MCSECKSQFTTGSSLKVFAGMNLNIVSHYNLCNQSLLSTNVILKSTWLHFIQSTQVAYFTDLTSSSHSLAFTEFYSNIFSGKKLYLLFIIMIVAIVPVYTRCVFNSKSGCTLQFSPFHSILCMEMEERASVFHRLRSMLPFIDCRTVLSLKSQVVSRTNVSI